MRTSGLVELQKPKSSAWNVSHSLAKPFSSGRPEIAIAPTRKNSAVHGIRSQQAAELLDLPRARRHHHAAGAEEQQPLEDRVIQHVVEARGDADRRESRRARGERRSCRRRARAG